MSQKPKKKKKTPAQLAKDIERLERGARVVELKKSGASFRAIAAQLQREGSAEVTHMTVQRDYIEAMQVMAENRDDEAEICREMQIQRLEANLLAHYPASIGKVEMVVNPDTKQSEKKITKPDVGSGWLVLSIIREISETMNIKVKKHEHTGKDGNPIENHNVEMSLADWKKQSAARTAQAAETLEMFEDESADEN